MDAEQRLEFSQMQSEIVALREDVEKLKAVVVSLYVKVVGTEAQGAAQTVRLLDVNGDTVVPVSIFGNPLNVDVD